MGSLVVSNLQLQIKSAVKWNGVLDCLNLVIIFDSLISFFARSSTCFPTEEEGTREPDLHLAVSHMHLEFVFVDAYPLCPLNKNHLVIKCLGAIADIVK